MKICFKNIARPLLLAALIAIPSIHSDAKGKVTGKLGMKAPALSGLEFAKGDAVEMKEGQVYVVEFWATWCGPCVRGIPHLTKLQNEYKDKGVTIVSVSREPMEKIKPFVEKQGDKMDYTVARDAKGDVNKGYQKAFGIGYIPSAYIVDKSGNIAWQGHPSKIDQVLADVVAGTYKIVEAPKK